MLPSNHNFGKNYKSTNRQHKLAEKLVSVGTHYCV